MKKLFIPLFLLLLTSFLFAQSNDSCATKSCCSSKAKPKVTFVELGSVNCIPCKQMVPVMKAIEEKYGDQIEVIFHDVWKPEEKHFAEEFGIKLIPTQVFLDASGKEFHRHEGYYPEEEIAKILKEKGITPIKTEG